MSVLATAAVAFVITGAGATVTAHVTARADPASNLPYTYPNFLDAVNAGRALEGLAPISDIGRGQFSVTQEMFVVINLERIARGLPAFEEMTASLDALAQTGRTTGGSSAPRRARCSGGHRHTVGGDSRPAVRRLRVDVRRRLYPVAQQAAFNTGCSALPPDPWEHRHNILEDFSLVGGGMQPVDGSGRRPELHRSADRGLLRGRRARGRRLHLGAG